MEIHLCSKIRFPDKKIKNLEKEKNGLEIRLNSIFIPNFGFLTLTDSEISLRTGIPLKYTKIGYFWAKIGPNIEKFQKLKNNFRFTYESNVHAKFLVPNPYRC